MNLPWVVTFAVLYIYSGQVTWTNLALHAVLSGDNAQVWQEARLGRPTAVIVKAVFLLAWPLIVFATWLYSLFSQD